MKIYNMEQGSDEWFQVRLGKITGSTYYKLLGSGQYTETWKKAAERITGVRNDTDKFSNKHTERGHELESQARSIYELLNNVTVDEVGFIEKDDETGCSPDGIINEDGMVEIKCRDNHLFLKTKQKGLTKQEKIQIQFNLFISGSMWCDYIGYNPNYPNSLHVIRVERDEEMIKEISDNVLKFNTKIREIVNNELKNQ